MAPKGNGKRTAIFHELFENSREFSEVGEELFFSRECCWEPVLHPCETVPREEHASTMPFYRLFVIARNDLAKSSIAPVFEQCINTVQKSGGVFQKVTNLGEKQLQYVCLSRPCFVGDCFICLGVILMFVVTRYPIHCKDPQKIYRSGYQYILNFCSSPDALAQVQHDLKETRQVCAYVGFRCVEIVLENWDWETETGIWLQDLSRRRMDELAWILLVMNVWMSPFLIFRFFDFLYKWIWIADSSMCFFYCVCRLCSILYGSVLFLWESQRWCVEKWIGKVREIEGEIWLRKRGICGLCGLSSLMDILACVLQYRFIIEL